MTDSSMRNLYLGGAVSLLIADVMLIISGNGHLPISGLVLFLMFYAVAYMVKYTKTMSGLSFTFQIFAFSSFALYFPDIFTNWGFNTQVLVVPAVQVIMFGMGTKLNLGDFLREFKKPVKIVIGTALVYITMPLAAVIIIKVCHFPAEVAAGVILIGACPSGVSSNVMVYLANGNLALSISLTTFATLMSPIVTPFIMQVFAGQLIDVDTLGMMISIINMIFVPVGAGLICNKILYGNVDWLSKANNLIVLSVVCFIIGLVLIFIPFFSMVRSLQSGLVLVFWAVALVTFIKMLFDRAQSHLNWMDIVLPNISLSSIMLYIIIVSAHNKVALLSIGPALFVATTAHNLLGLILGYGSAKALRLKDADVRTFTIEVGMKNAGLGLGLAYDVLRSEAAALASLIFAPLEIISGSTLANFWRQRPPREESKS